MLDFLREQGNESSAVQEQQDAVDNSSSETGNGTEGYVAVTNQSKNAHKSTIILGVLFCAGLLSLVFMVRESTPQVVSASISPEEMQIEKIIASMGGDNQKASGDIDGVVKQFAEFSNVQQVDTWDLVKNPFKHEIFLGDAFDSDAFNFDAGSRQGSLELFSIMKSGSDDSAWCCMIDDKILYDGDWIKDFQVVEISSTSVKLESQETELILKLDE